MVVVGSDPLCQPHAARNTDRIAAWDCSIRRRAIAIRAFRPLHAVRQNFDPAGTDCDAASFIRREPGGSL